MKILFDIRGLNPAAALKQPPLTACFYPACLKWLCWVFVSSVELICWVRTTRFVVLLTDVVQASCILLKSKCIEALCHYSLPAHVKWIFIWLIGFPLRGQGYRLRCSPFEILYVSSVGGGGWWRRRCRRAAWAWAERRRLQSQHVPQGSGTAKNSGVGMACSWVVEGKKEGIKV